MSLVRFGRWTVRADPARTRAAYVHAIAASEECGCNVCKNYIAARDNAFSAEARAVFDAVGVDRRREIEVYHTRRVARGRHAYEGWFHLFGAIESGRDAFVARPGVPGQPATFVRDLEPCGDGVSLGFTAHLSKVTSLWINAAVVELEFEVIVPWLLDIDEPS